MSRRQPRVPTDVIDRLRAVAIMAALAPCGLAQAEPLRVASWNLGWHVAAAELAPWISACAKSYTRDSASGTWTLASPDAPGSQRGWDITEYRAKIAGSVAIAR